MATGSTGFFAPDHRCNEQRGKIQKVVMRFMPKKMKQKTFING